MVHYFSLKCLSLLFAKQRVFLRVWSEVHFYWLLYTSLWSYLVSSFILTIIFMPMLLKHIYFSSIVLDDAVCGLLLLQLLCLHSQLDVFLLPEIKFEEDWVDNFSSWLSLLASFALSRLTVSGSFCGMKLGSSYQYAIFLKLSHWQNVKSLWFSSFEYLENIHFLLLKWLSS